MLQNQLGFQSRQKKPKKAYIFSIKFNGLELYDALNLKMAANLKCKPL